MGNTVVFMQGICKYFSGTPANNNIDFKLEKGTIHGLLGENGAGKTTLMNILFGLYKTEAGKIFINGEPVEIHNPTGAMKLGIGMVHQHFMLVKPLTVTENIMLGTPSSRRPFLDTQNVRRNIIELSKKYNLKIDPDARIWQLSVGEEQRVEILSAIYRGADILILDEPTSVLTPGETEELFRILEKMRQDGKSIILISHKLEEILAIADEVTILRNGVKTGEQKISEKTTKQELTRLMVGRDVLFDFKGKDSNIGETKLTVENLTSENDRGLRALNQVSFSIRSGEILGLAGVDGNGQKELCEVLTGLRPSLGGRIFLNGEELTNKKAETFIEKKIAYIPEDRQKTGLIMNWEIQRNLILKNYRHSELSHKIFLNFQSIKKFARRLMDEYKIKAGSENEKVKILSGGNQQKVILAREMSAAPELLIANQPTRGLDIGATEYVRQRILDQKSKGAAILLVSADLEEIKQLSDRIAVIYNGRILDVLDSDASVETIGMLMAGVVREKKENYV